MVKNNNVYTYHHNPLGSTVAITDNRRVIINTYSYTPYGQIVDQIETIKQPFKYVGKYGVMTEANGLYYMRARYYDSETGRFISEDPKGLDAGVNLYAYAEGNPVLLSDPNGQCPMCYWGAELLVAGGRMAAPYIVRAAVLGFNAARTFIYTNPVATAAVTNPALYNSTVTLTEFAATTATDTAGPLSTPRPSGSIYLDAAINLWTIGNAVDGMSIFASKQTTDNIKGH